MDARKEQARALLREHGERNADFYSTPTAAAGGEVTSLEQLFDGTAAGVVLRQIAPFGGQTNYAISALPAGVRVARTPGDPERWQPTAEELDDLPVVAVATEKSNIVARKLMLNFHPLEIRVNPAGGAAAADGRPPALSLRRPCRCGIVFGPCCAERVVAEADGARLGEVRETCSLCSRLGLYARFSDSVRVRPDAGAPPIQGMSAAAAPDKPRERYRMDVDLKCCGVNNCLGASCLRNDQVFFLRDLDGSTAAHVQRTYAPGGRGLNSALVRYLWRAANNYVVEFPADATPDERRMIMASVVHLDLLHFSSLIRKPH